MSRLDAVLLVLGMVWGTAAIAHADPPDAKYIFPAGGQRGTIVPVRIGGCNFHDQARLHLMGHHVQAAPSIQRRETVWFEGPLIPIPASQQSEDYPQDYANTFEISADAATGDRYWKVSTSQGVTGSRVFVVGDLPEVIEQERAGQVPPTAVTLPVTINGRIFPREDVDLWSFHVLEGQTVSAWVDAQRFGSPLQARLEVLDPSGRPIVEGLTQTGAEARIRFTAAASGRYVTRIHAISAGGLQHYVYRLTVTTGAVIDRVFPLGGRRGAPVRLELTGANLEATEVTANLPATEADRFEFHPSGKSGVGHGISLELDDLPEHVEVAGRPAGDPVEFPAILNGRIEAPGDQDEWPFTAMKGREFDFDLRAARLGSPLDSVLSILSADGKVLAENDDAASGQSDSRLRFTVPETGVYRVRITDRLPDRGDARFAYRLRVSCAEQAEWRLRLANDAVACERTKPGSLKLLVERGPGVNGEITLEFQGVPVGMTVSPAIIPAGASEVNLVFQPGMMQPIACAPIQISGRMVHGNQVISRPAQMPGRASTSEPDPVWAAVTLPTPFRFAGVFETKFMPRGSHYVRHYTIQRNGFDGPLEARMADQQGRHLQGLSGEAVKISPGTDQFDFVVKLPSWMEVGRTSRATLMVLGTITDIDGSRHTVSYSSNAQNDQMIALVDPGRLAITLERRTLTATPGGSGEVGFRLQRAAGLTAPAQVTLLAPNAGLSAAPAIVSPAETGGVLRLEFPESLAPFSEPVVIRATTVDERGLPVHCDTALEIVTAMERETAVDSSGESR